MTLIIFCHPDPRKQSHSHKVLKHVEKALQQQKKKYEVLDLYKKDFDCVLSDTEYCRIKDRSKKTDQDVKKIQDKISSSKTLVFIYPTWWYNMPAALKGFMDRVFTAGFAYNFFHVNKIMLLGAWMLSWLPGIRYLLQPIAVTGHLKGKKAIVFRTYGGPALGKRMFGNTSHKTLEQVVLRYCGITNITTHELFNCDKSTYTQDYENQYMKQVEQICKKV